MIQTLEIQNFKSIRHLQMDCRRVNLFIGEPNTGKSNILEALGLFSIPHTWEIQDFVRMESMDDLFYEHDISQRVMVRYDGGESSESMHRAGVRSATMWSAGLYLRGWLWFSARGWKNGFSRQQRKQVRIHPNLLSPIAGKDCTGTSVRETPNRWKGFLCW